MTAKALLTLAQAEIGTVEHPAGSNNVKYNTAYYGREVSDKGYAWCAVFLWWLFAQADAAQLYYGGKKTAYCPTLLSDYQKKGLSVDGGYQPGDIIFFNFSGKTNAVHVGLCESYDGKTIVTIDGNTGTTNEANGGAVMRRARSKRYIVGAARPEYEQEDADMTKEQFKTMMDEYLKELGQLPPSDWSQDARQWAQRCQVIAGDEHGDMQYKRFCTREELVQILFNQNKKK